MAGEPRKPRIRRRRIIERPRLLRALDRSEARIRMLVAGSGYGKTTLLEQWAAHGGRKVGWFRAGPSAADVAVVASALAVASDRVLPGAGRRMRERLAVTQDPERDARLLAEMLAEDLRDWPDDGWIAIDDYEWLTAATTPELFVETVFERSPIQLLVASRIRPTWVDARLLLSGRAFEAPASSLGMTSEEIEQVVGSSVGGVLGPALVALADGWPALVGLIGMVDRGDNPDASSPAELYESYAEQLSHGLEPAVRTGLELIATMPMIDRELVTVLLGAERAEHIVDEALALGVLDERDGRLELHELLESFLLRGTKAETKLHALEAFPTIWEYYKRRNEPDAAFDLADRFGMPSDIDRLLVGSMDELLTGARLSTLETWVARATDLVGETPAVVVAQAEIALRRGRHLTAQTLAERAARAEGLAEGAVYRAYITAGRAAHFRLREEDALALYQHAESVSVTEGQRREAKWGQLTAAASLERDLAHDLLRELHVPPSGDFDPAEAVRSADKALALGIRFGSVPGLTEARRVEELVPAVSDPFVRGSFRCMFSYALNLAAEYAQALDVAKAMAHDAAEFRVEFAGAYASLMQGIALTGLRRFDDAYQCLNTAFAQAVRCSDPFGQQAVYAARVRALLHEGRAAEACALEPPDLTDSLPGMRGEVWASRGLALACIGRLDEAQRLAEIGSEATRAVEATVLAQCIHAVAGLKARRPTLTKSLRKLMRTAWDARAVDCVVTSYRASPDLLAALLRDTETAERSGYIVGRAADQDLAASIGVDLAAAVDPVSTLSGREREVYDLLCEGLTNREIAKRLFISVETVKAHAHHIYDKVGIRSRTALALQAARRRPQTPPTTAGSGASDSSTAEG